MKQAAVGFALLAALWVFLSATPVPPAAAQPPRQPPATRPATRGDVTWIEVAAPDGTALAAAVARPRSSGPFPVVVVLHGSEGFRPHYLDLARRIADAGFVTLAGAWFGGSRPAGRDRPFPDVIACPRCPEFRGAGPASLPHVTALIEAARRLPDVSADRVGLFGHSAGAGMAVLAASSGAGVQAVAASGAGYARSTARGATPLTEIAASLAAPILILHGTADAQADVEGARRYERALRQLGKPVDAQYFEGAPHGMPFRGETQARVQQLLTTFFQARLAGPRRRRRHAPPSRLLGVE